jgi:hypothetical protein
VKEIPRLFFYQERCTYVIEGVLHFKSYCCKQFSAIIITSGMIIIDDIMSEIELEISRVRKTSEMSCFNFTNLISSMINHTTYYIR